MYLLLDSDCFGQILSDTAPPANGCASNLSRTLLLTINM
jgi:hypothetical protein